MVSEYVTLDGVMEEPGTWSFQFWNGEIAKFKFDELFASDSLLLGRVTYQGIAAAWQSMTDEEVFADRMRPPQVCSFDDPGRAPRVEQFEPDQGYIAE